MHFNFEFIDFAGHQRLRIVMVIKWPVRFAHRLVPGRMVRCLEPAFGDIDERRIDFPGPVRGRLRRLIRDFDNEIGIRAGRGCIELEHDRADDFNIFFQDVGGEGQDPAHRVHAVRSHGDDPVAPFGIGIAV
jgi:hypothetical protein